ncbi:MAG: PTS glucose transporter subunit IIA [Oscillospiraceae bacterium]|nr:PTS glucose transporter subunit IIA [Oscillospiraceae bacterium]
MEQINGRASEKRILANVTDGNVIAVGELLDGVYSKKLSGDGYAVMPAKKLWIFEGGNVELSAPADGVVTEIGGGRLTMRTGDGISVCVVMGEAAKLFTDVGGRLSAGEHFCTLPPKKYLRRSLYSGAIPVLITEPRRVTELHILSGYHKSGEKAAQYKALYDV